MSPEADDKDLEETVSADSPAVEADADAGPAEAAVAEEDEAQAAEVSEEAAEKPKPARRRRSKPKEPVAEEPVAEADAPTEEPVAAVEETAAEEPVVEAEEAVAEEAVAEKDAEEPVARPLKPRQPVADAEAEEPTADEEDAEEAVAEAVEERPVRRRRRSRSAVEPEAPAKAERPARRRQAAGVPGVRPVVRAQAKYVRSSARKARLVCDNIRGKSVVEARAILAHTPRAVARDWSKLLESAVANAEHNHELVGEDLYVKAVHADEGPTAKRFRPRALGRATRIRKRTAHLTILLTPKD